MTMKEKQHIIRMEMGERIRREREAIGMSRNEFAERIGVSEKTVIHIETGGQGTTVYRIIEIADVLNTSTDYLLRGYRDTIMKSEEEELAEKAAEYIRKAPAGEKKIMLEMIDDVFNYARRIKDVK